MPFSNFLANTKGNFAITTALLAIPLLGAAGYAVDYVAYVNAKQDVQDAVDTAALVAARHGGKKSPEMTKLSHRFFNSNLKNAVGLSITNRKLKVKKTSQGYEYTYQANFDRPTSIMGIFGLSSMSQTLTATSRSGIDELEIALVLDSTGSMGNANKMNELKGAVDTFLDQFASGGNMRVSVVPFDTQVRLDKVKFGNSKLDNPDSPYDPDADCNSLSGDEQAICLKYQAACATSSSGDDDDDDDDDFVSTAPRSSDICSTTAKSTKDNTEISANNDLLGAAAAEWTGCVIDRVQPFDVSADPATSANSDSLYPTAHCATSNLQPILPLTKNFNKVRTHVNNMQPAGNTNLTIGIQWGLETLSKPLPYRQTKSDDPGKSVRQMMILVTDGQNTQNRWTTDTSDIDDRAELACANAKLAVEKLFTIRVVDGNASLLASCASQPDYYYDIDSAAELEDAFSAIANNIARIALVN